jgi:hypothetical protein
MKGVNRPVTTDSVVLITSEVRWSGRGEVMQRSAGKQQNEVDQYSSLFPSFTILVGSGRDGWSCSQCGSTEGVAPSCRAPSSLSERRASAVDRAWVSSWGGGAGSLQRHSRQHGNVIGEG